jgi:nucleoside-diphosphate-sugar epimerase
MKKVLITGMSGLLGGLLRKQLEAVGGYELSALNRSLVEGVECFQSDVADLEAIRPAFEGKDVVLHLSGTGDDDWGTLLHTNVIGTYNVYEAARLAGVKRVIYASSGNTIRGWDFVEPYKSLANGRYEDVPVSWPMITHDMVRPLGIYGATKVWGEALGRHFSDAYGMSILCVRIGAVRPEDHPREVRENTSYLSHRDVVQILEKCVEAPDDLMYDIFLATSNNKWGYRDLEHPKQVLGYVPQDSVDNLSKDS